MHAITEEELLENLAWVQALARRLVSDPGRAEDVAQDAWLSALERPPRGTSGATLRAWLASVVRTMARQSFRSETLRRRRELAVARDEAQPCASDVLARTAMLQRVVAAVVALDEPERTTVLLHYVDGLSSRAIAERLGETPAAVRKRLSRALARLRGKFARELGDDRESWIQALAPFAFGGGGNATRVALGNSLGGVLVSKTSWTVGVVVALVALSAGGWYFLEGTGPSKSGARGEMEAVTLPPAVTHASDEDETAAKELAATGEEEPARIAFEPQESLSGPVYVLADPDANPVAGAELLVCRDGSVLARGETDAKGRFAPKLEEEGAAKLLVLARGWPAQVHEVSLAPQTHELSLLPGAVLSGRIVVDDGVPAERIPLLVIADGVLLDFEAELGAPADELGVSRTLWKLVRTRAAEDGSFRFDGLPLGWSGSLELPSDYKLTDPTQIEFEGSPWRTHLDETSGHLRIEVTKRLALRGRGVDSRDGRVVPVADVVVRAAIQYGNPASNKAYTPQALTDPDGGFRFPLQDTAVHGGYLYLHTLDDTLSRQVDLEPREVSGDWDLGDVPIVDPETTRTVQLVVLDPQGSPISGAVAGVSVSSPVSAPTDANGRTELRGVVPNSSTIVVYAARYQVGKASVPKEVPEELVIDMQRGAGLALNFVTANGEPARRLRASLLASRNPVRQGEPYPTSIQALIAAECSTYHWTQAANENGSLVMHTDREGRVIANDLEPGLPLHLRVKARSGQLLLEQEIAALAPEEWRELEVVVGESPREFHGRVLDGTGDPILRASVVVSLFPTGDGQGVSSSGSSGVEADGSFTLRGLYSSSVSFVIRAPGFVSRSIEDYQLPADDTPVEFRLAAGHEVLVRVADVRGRPVPAGVRVRLQGETQLSYVRAAEFELGAYLLRDLPAEEVTIHLRIHGVSYSRPHDPRIPELQIEVPVLGALEATLRIPADLELSEWCHLWLLPQDDSGTVRRYALIDSAGTGAASLPDVLPGSYYAVVRRWNGVEMGPDAWFEEFPGDHFEELSPRVQLVIRPAETTRADIWP